MSTWGWMAAMTAGVSRRHAILAHKNSLYTVEDLGSANGTFVNGQRLAPQTPTPIEQRRRAQVRHAADPR